ncbi:zinc finger protein ZAT5 [Sesamum indicum]|uniref:Zinc finger protein ZAT5 n=1 Tax=Sesamum indicum TaxID=4182 RepID=A0A6I9TR04_SESIN|nr:zinc finger protein ZAT5 [Sesamum indicum]
MMDMEILEDFSGSNDQTIVKGKRTKRLRQSSSASSSGGGCVGGGGEFRGHSLVSSPTTSSGVSTTTEEDEDMANCLILLAQGGGFSSQSEEEIKEVENKFSSRKLTEMTTTTAGKVGIYVYECKTCSRAFPSFQALGGHRASHKKPKPTTDIDQKNSPPDDQQHEVEEGESSKLHTVPPPPPPPPSTQSPNKNFHVDHQINKPKIHECSICGSEFASGQALGGHMRRHRPVAMATNSTTTTTTTATRSANDSSSNDVIGEKTRNVLALDLNLPAPAEDERRDANFHQFSSNQQPRLVFSAAAPLVDCHY